MTPSPPPSPPQSLARRLSFLMAAEDAVARTHAYPNYPANFLTEVQPHLCRYIVAEGKALRKSCIHAVYAVLVRNDRRNDAATDAEVARTLHAAVRTARRWKLIIDTLRAEAADAAALLDLAAAPPFGYHQTPSAGPRGVPILPRAPHSPHPTQPPRCAPCLPICQARPAHARENGRGETEALPACTSPCPTRGTSARLARAPTSRRRPAAPNRSSPGAADVPDALGEAPKPIARPPRSPRKTEPTMYLDGTMIHVPLYGYGTRDSSRVVG